MRSVEVPPNAENLINSLRSMGYQLETALADVIDNSIAASSTEIDINFKWNNSKCVISILDNGLLFLSLHIILICTGVLDVDDIEFVIDI
jgi:hypothetical protein